MKREDYRPFDRACGSLGTASPTFPRVGRGVPTAPLWPVPSRVRLAGDSEPYLRMVGRDVPIAPLWALHRPLGSLGTAGPTFRR